MSDQHMCDNVTAVVNISCTYDKKWKYYKHRDGQVCRARLGVEKGSTEAKLDPMPKDKRSSRARHTDHQTSHDAAESVSLTPNRMAVLLAFGVRRNSADGMTDETLLNHYGELSLLSLKRYHKQSPSGLRTRRGELVRMKLIEENGTTEGMTGRKMIVWRLTAKGRTVIDKCLGRS